MKTIKDAVIELEGELPEWYMNANCWAIHNGLLTYFDMNCNPAVAIDMDYYKAEAKRMGYINGYRWGVEYTTNGKRPDLPDDVLVDVKCATGSNKWMGYNGLNVRDACWEKSSLYEIEASSFKITDPRYKPVDEVSEIPESKPDAESVSENTESNWFERGELPPVGWHGEIKWGIKEGLDECVILPNHHFAFYDGKDWVVYDLKAVPTAKFRPIRTEREKVIETALDAAIENDGLYGPLVPHINQMLERIYDAGMLVLPPKKSDTED